MFIASVAPPPVTPTIVIRYELLGYNGLNINITLLQCFQIADIAKRRASHAYYMGYVGCSPAQESGESRAKTLVETRKIFGLEPADDDVIL